MNSTQDPLVCTEKSKITAQQCVNSAQQCMNSALCPLKLKHVQKKKKKKKRRRGKHKTPNVGSSRSKHILSVRLDLDENYKLFYYLAYFLLLFMDLTILFGTIYDHTVLFQLTFTFIYFRQ